MASQNISVAKRITSADFYFDFATGGKFNVLNDADTAFASITRYGFNDVLVYGGRKPTTKNPLWAGYWREPSIRQQWRENLFSPIFTLGGRVAFQAEVGYHCRISKININYEQQARG